MLRVAGVMVCLGLAMGTARGAEKPVWLAVGRPGLVEGLKALVEHRQAEGFETVISTSPIDEALAKLGKKPAYLVLVGDDEKGREGEPWYLAAKKRPLYRWQDRQQTEFASDALWGDLDGDLAPDIPVGRIPARTRAEVELVAGKIVAYEKAAPTLDDLRLPLWAGSPQYGGSADSMATGMLLASIKNYAPGWSTPWVICANRKHPLCGVASEQCRLFTEQMKRGGAMTLMMGHGSVAGFCSLADEKGTVTYSEKDAKDILAKGLPTAPMVVFTCDSGNFTAPGCMTKAFLMMPGGPVATIGATTVTHPLPNYYSGMEMLKRLSGKYTRLGDLWLESEREAMKSRSLLIDKMLADVEGKLEPVINVAHLRRDQLLVYALLGDPATRLKFPQELEVKVERKNGAWTWEAKKPKGATRLQVFHKPLAPEFPAMTEGLGEDETRKLFNEFNGKFEFAPETTPKKGQKWRGKMDKEGKILFVATGEAALYVAVVRLEVPAEAAK